jgi:hypothetical protein
MRDIRRKIAADEALKAVFAHPLSLSYRVLIQKKRQQAPKVYSLHAPEVECIGKGKAHKPYEFGVKVSLATTVAPQYACHAYFAGLRRKAHKRRLASRWARRKPGVAFRGSQLKVTPHRCAKALAILSGRDGMRCA